MDVGGLDLSTDVQVAANDASPIAKVADPWPPLLIIIIIIIIIIIVVIIVVIISMVILLLIIHIYCSYYYLHSPALGKHTVASFLFKSPQLGNLDLELISLSLSIYIYIYTHTHYTHTENLQTGIPTMRRSIDVAGVPTEAPPATPAREVESSSAQFFQDS